MCVRYRQDKAANRRYTTVEVIVDEGPITDSTACCQTPGESVPMVRLQNPQVDVDTREWVVKLALGERVKRTR